MERRIASISGGDGISRRDFIEGALVATGGLALSSFTPQTVVAKAAACGDALAEYARLLRVSRGAKARKPSPRQLKPPRDQRQRR
ncbi:MAG TPA: twin-arginine translocation signal domain-containing protein [Methylocystis sp.]|nr:twin-arginine translocation signal domain-containing protein [Methylocystis sp.]